MVRTATFRSLDGISLVGTVTLPESARSALLMVHGIPSNKNEWGFYSDMATFFAERHVASLRFDFRGCGESEAFPISDLTLSAMVDDIDAGYWELRRAIPSNLPIHAVGTSCGGGVTLRWHNLTRRPVRAVHLMAPVLDYEYEVTGHRRSMTEGESLLPPEVLQRLKQGGAANADIGYGRAMLHEAHLFDGRGELERASCSITVYQGGSDSVVPISITRSILDGFPRAELVTIADADHGFAVAGDEDLTHPGTKKNHYFVYGEMLKRM